MLEFVDALFQSRFMPHGHCYLWRADLVALHVGSDGLIALSYFSIPFALVYFVRRRQDLLFKGAFFMFSAFILACGLTHFMAIWSVWAGNYYLTGFVKLVTAGFSVATAVMMWPLIPKALALPSPEVLREANAALEREVAEREKTKKNCGGTVANSRPSWPNARARSSA